MEEGAEEVERGRSCRHCPLETAGPVEEVEEAGLGGQQRRAKLEEEEGEAGDLPEWEVVEEAGLLVFPV